MSRGAVARSLTALFGLVVSLSINFHSFIADFNLVPGDRGDARLVIFTLEHWFKVFQGREAFYVLQMFYPDRLALGYADGLFLFSFPYAIFRVVGLDYFTSYQLLFVFMTMLGYATCLWLLQRALRLDLPFAALGAILLTSLNSVQFQAEIGKLLAFYFYPILLGLLYIYSRIRKRSGWQAWLSLNLFVGLLGLLFFTSYYPAWFFLFTLLLFAVVRFAVSWLSRGIRATVAGVVGFTRASWLQLLVSTTVLIISLIPFGLTYAPVVLSHSSRSFGLVLDFAPSVRDLINVSDRNYLWSPLLTWFHFKFGNREVQMGSPLLVLALFMFFYLRQLVFARRKAAAAASQHDDFIVALSTTAFVIPALIIKYHNVSLWYVVYSLVPGASALRAVGRYLIIVDMIVVVAVVYALNEAFTRLAAARAHTRRPLLGGFVILAAVLVAEQANGAAYRLDKADQLAFMGEYRAPGTPCATFFINNSPSADLPVGYYQLDAMMISMKLGIPTVNGYSGFAPAEVFTMVPTGAEYKYEILKWLQGNGSAAGICELDYRSKSFLPVDVASEYQKYLQLDRQGYLEAFSALFSAAQRFLVDKNPLSNLYPQYLEEHGYLRTSFGYQPGASYRWMQNRYSLGERSFGNIPCVGIGIVGTYDEIRGIIDGYGPRAIQIFFPDPQPLVPDVAVPGDTRGELLMLFPVEGLSH
jgi:hypothetical protein